MPENLKFYILLFFGLKKDYKRTPVKNLPPQFHISAVRKTHGIRA